MILKKLQKKFVYQLGWYVLLFCSLTVRMLPESATYGLARFLGLVWYALSGRHRGVALENLNNVFSRELAPGPIRRIARECFISMATSVFELLLLTKKNPDVFRTQRFRFVNRQYLDQALSRKKGVILASAHFGNFPLMLAGIAFAGYKPAAVMRPIKVKRIVDFFEGDRVRFGINTILTIPRAACVGSILRALRENQAIFIPLDQNFGTGGVFVDFFGRPAATATGPVVLAQRTGATILPTFIIRNADRTHTIVFEPPIVLEQGVSDAQTIKMNVQRITGIIESYVRRFPAEWSWIHKRWKAKLN